MKLKFKFIINFSAKKQDDQSSPQRNDIVLSNYNITIRICCVKRQIQAGKWCSKHESLKSVKFYATFSCFSLVFIRRSDKHKSVNIFYFTDVLSFPSNCKRCCIRVAWQEIISTPPFTDVVTYCLSSWIFLEGGK